MAEDTESNADPSMEEILASIRKIISDDNPPAMAAPKEPEVEPTPEPPEEEEVLELTQMIQDDGSIMDLGAPPEPEPEPEMQPPPPLAATESLVSEPVASSAASTFSSFANTVDIGRLSSGPNRSTYIGNGSRTLEDMVIELMRPLLRDWLDHNLSAVVERLVQKEIERISRRS